MDVFPNLRLKLYNSRLELIDFRLKLFNSWLELTFLCGRLEVC